MREKWPAEQGTAGGETRDGARQEITEMAMTVQHVGALHFFSFNWEALVQIFPALSSNFKAQSYEISKEEFMI